MAAIMHIIHKENGNGSEDMGMLPSRNMLKEMWTLSCFMKYEEQLKVAIASEKLMFVLQLLNEVGLHDGNLKPTQSCCTLGRALCLSMCADLRLTVTCTPRLKLDPSRSIGVCLHGL
ncbi:hypothetical protein SELMODRAFT_429078 [Selaginella moellendorffii]|uniref:Uncharacterized protein n=1 Tax=Selaginella moellendorffii TaxID=88036 RepID=D8T4Z9_SELML|nr:hypothetical protein SELMODRAFT_429078 [Selaginella moellendorffii]